MNNTGDVSFRMFRFNSLHQCYVEMKLMTFEVRRYLRFDFRRLSLLFIEYFVLCYTRMLSFRGNRVAR